MGGGEQESFVLAGHIQGLFDLLAAPDLDQLAGLETKADGFCLLQMAIYLFTRVDTRQILHPVEDGLGQVP
jgi:hypothetical protein